MAHVLKDISFTCTPRVLPQRNKRYLPFSYQLKLVLIYRPRKDRRLSLPGWLHVTFRD